MATRDRSSHRLRREQRLAAALLRRHQLSPPIPIAQLANEYADVETAALPAGDGCVIGLTRLPRPRILLRSGRAEARERFTLAHELGHIFLPWHLGHVACHTRVTSTDYEERSGGSDEAEANRFAAELLVPSRWLTGIIDELGVERVAPILRRVQAANVSAHVACLRVVSALPPGHVFALLDGRGIVEMSGRSTDTIAPRPAEGAPINKADFDRFAAGAESLTFRGRKLLWWRFAGAAELGDIEADPRPSGAVLADLAAAYANAEDDAQRLAMRVNGIMSYAHGQARQQGHLTEEELVVWLRSRFAARADLPRGLLQDPDLDIYLRKRSRDLAAKARRS